MRLLNVESHEFTVFLDKINRPKYAIASHRWNQPFEAAFKDVQKKRNRDGLGQGKIEAFAKYIKINLPHVDWLWIDTCCIDKDSAAELSEAVNLMFEWYRGAELCIAYLADVEVASDKDSFRKSEWFRRGWTLQELLAPQTVVFVSKTWQVIGHKGEAYQGSRGLETGPALEEDIARITGIPAEVLRDYGSSLGLSVDERLQWMNGRETTREEDMSYALYGIFQVTPGANYGEKRDGARKRLMTAIHQHETDAAHQADRYRKIAHWISPPDPWTNHETARQQHEPQTGVWLLESDPYRAWKSGSIPHLWIYGQAGCGKTILCSTAIEDVRKHCASATNAGQAIFYFSFSDNRKQTYVDVLHSLVVQLGWKEPGLSTLRQTYEKSNGTLPGSDEMQTILLACLASYNEVFLHLDALDECPESDDIRSNVLERVKQLLHTAPNVQMLATSRDAQDTREHMTQLGAETMYITARTVDADIQKFVSTQLACDRRLSRLDARTQAMIEETLTQKANGMFRWVYCQLHEIKKFKSTKPKSIKAALLALPPTLDETYERMLNGINEEDHQEALILLRWIAYVQSPVTLVELADTTIIYTSADGTVDFDNRGGWEDALEILSGLVTVEAIDEEDQHTKYESLDAHDDVGSDSNIARSDPRITHLTTIRLAHFSVKEYLESQRILASSAKMFHLDPSREHGHLAQSCLVYLMQYSESSQKTSTKEDLARFPLLQYAARSWYHHSSRKLQGDNTREICFLTSEGRKVDWLRVHQPEAPSNSPFDPLEDIGSEVYYAVVMGLEAVVKDLLSTEHDLNAQGGLYGNALQAASERGHEKVVQMLIHAGAEVNARGGYYGNALEAASVAGHEKVVQMLIRAGAEVNAQGGLYGNALQAASERGHEKVVQMLIHAGAEVNAQGGLYGNALQAASERGHEKVVQMLIHAGAEVNARGGYYGNALEAASVAGHEKVVQMLIRAGAEVNAQGGRYGNALRAAIEQGHEKVVQMLVGVGAKAD